MFVVSNKDKALRRVSMLKKGESEIQKVLLCTAVRGGVDLTRVAEQRPEGGWRAPESRVRRMGSYPNGARNLMG